MDLLGLDLGQVLENIWYYGAVFIIVLTILVFVHEWGHYWIAKKSGVRIEVFSIGFGPEIFGITDKSGTRWKFAAIPLGGYVKMFGEGETGFDEELQEERPLTDDEKKVSFHHKTLWQRSAIVFGGPLANFIFAAIVVALVGMAVGTPKPFASIGTVQEGSAAEAAGLQAGDRIQAIDGQEVTWFSDLSDIVSARPGQPMAILVDRGGVPVTVTATPATIDGPDGPIGRLGVGVDPAAVEYERMGPLEASWAGVEYTVGLTVRIMGHLGELVTGQRSMEELGGPIRIAEISGDMAQGGMLQIVMLMAALSVNLGLINLFPIPILDGGRLMFYAYEAVAGRPLGEKAEEYGLRFGLSLVLILIVVITWNDIMRLAERVMG